MEVLPLSSFAEDMIEYKRQMQDGTLRRAYVGLVDYIKGLRVHLKKSYPEYNVSGSIYQGFMDMTFFNMTPKELKEKRLKVAIVFLHESVSFEVWVTGENRQVQKKYSESLKGCDLKGYRLTLPGKGIDSIIEHTITASPDLSDTDALTIQIENEVLRFSKDIVSLVSLN